jgi:hypothetical protein
LLGADLRGAKLSGADLRQATGVNLAGILGTPNHPPDETCPRIHGLRAECVPVSMKPGTGIPDYVCHAHGGP